MYGLLLFFTVCSLWLFVRFTQAPVDSRTTSRRAWLALTLVNLLLVYTHYYGWLVVGLELLAVLLRRRRKLAPYAASVAALKAMTSGPPSAA